MPKVVTHREESALFGAGMLGHTWVVLVPDRERDKLRIYLHCSDPQSCVRAVDEQRDPDACRIYTKVRNGWKLVPYRAAAIA